MPELLKVIAFEPDNTAAQAITTNLSGEIVVNKAVWSHKEDLTLFITRDQGSSSVFRPSQKATRDFQSKHMEPRFVTSTNVISGVALDEVMKDLTDVGGSF